MVQAPIKPAPAVKRENAGSAAVVGAPPLTLRLPPQWTLTDELIVQLAALNESWLFERSAKGALIISPPPGNLNSRRGGIIYAQVWHWSFDIGEGFATPADGGMHLPDGSLLVPDASWISNEHLAEIDVDDEGVWSVVPDFVLEVCSPSQDIADQKDKLERWMANGVRLGWLLDAFEGEVWIYREAGRAGVAGAARHAVGRGCDGWAHSGLDARLAGQERLRAVHNSRSHRSRAGLRAAAARCPLRARV